MKVVIAGAGGVGTQLARQLIDENRDVVLIEKDPERAKFASEQLDCIVLHEESNSLDALRRAGIDKAEFFIAVTDSDEVNMILCGLVSSEFEVPFKIARVRNVDYSNAKILQNGFLDIDYVVNPEIEAARSITRAVEHGARGDIMLFEHSDYQMRSLVADEFSSLSNRSVGDIRSKLAMEFLVAVILREDETIIPSGTTMVLPNDTLYLVATEENLEKIMAFAGKKKRRLDKIVIVGGGKIGILVAEHLFGGTENRQAKSWLDKLANGFGGGVKRSINIIEKDPAKCRDLSERFPEAMVISGDISDEGIFEEGHFSDYDLLITATGNQELNLVTAVYSKKLGIKRTIALVNKNSYVNIAASLGIDVAVSLKSSIVNSILKFIRRGNVRSVHAIPGGKIEVMQMTVGDGCKAAGKRLADIKFPPHSLIIFIVREGRGMLPDGSLELQAGDDVVIISGKESIKRIEDLFLGRAA